MSKRVYVCTCGGGGHFRVKGISGPILCHCLNKVHETLEEKQKDITARTVFPGISGKRSIADSSKDHQ